MSLFAYGYLAVLHVKGEAIGYIKFVQVIIFVCSLAVIHEFLVRRRIGPDHLETRCNESSGGSTN